MPAIVLTKTDCTSIANEMFDAIIRDREMYVNNIANAVRGWASFELQEGECFKVKLHHEVTRERILEIVRRENDL